MPPRYTDTFILSVRCLAGGCKQALYHVEVHQCIIAIALLIGIACLAALL